MILIVLFFTVSVLHTKLCSFGKDYLTNRQRLLFPSGIMLKKGMGEAPVTPYQQNKYQVFI